MPVGQLMVGGIAIGSAYALLAVAYSVVYRTSRAINFAQGDLAILGAYLAFASTSVLGGSRVIGICAGIVAIAVLSVLIDTVAFQPLYRYGTVFVVASSIALVFVIETAISLIWGSQTISAPPLVGGVLHVGGVTITAQQILIVGVLVVLLAALQVLFRSQPGVAMRASAENRGVAELLGVSPRRMVAGGFALAGALSAVAGILLAPLTQLKPGAGGVLALSAIIAAIVGGFGSIPGAVIGGLLIGLLDVWADYVVGGGGAEIAVVGVFVLILVVRPTGLLGEEGGSGRR